MPARTHQSADPALVWVERAKSSRSGGGVASLPRPILDRPHLPFVQANAAVANAQTALTGRRRSLDMGTHPGLCAPPRGA